MPLGSTELQVRLPSALLSLRKTDLPLANSGLQCSANRCLPREWTRSREGTLPCLGIGPRAWQEREYDGIALVLAVLSGEKGASSLF